MRKPIVLAVPCAGRTSYPSVPLSTEDEESISQRITRITNDIADLKQFYNIEISPKRHAQLELYCKNETAALKAVPFSACNHDTKIDYLLLKNYLRRFLSQLELTASKNAEIKPLTPFSPKIIQLCESRQAIKPVRAQSAAEEIHAVNKSVNEITSKIAAGKMKVDKLVAYRAAQAIDQLHTHIKEWFEFYNGYDPLFTWWVKEPFGKLDGNLLGYARAVREKLVGGNEGTIVGQPIGPAALLSELKAEQIAYTPDEILKIGEKEYEWCLKEMMKASEELGYGSDWKAALEYVKESYVPPGEQVSLIRDLSAEAVDYVQKHDMITLPPISHLWRTFMIPPAQQAVSPFFLGGRSMWISYPTDEMEHEGKMMSMRGNNPHFSRSTVFHELLPGHHLQSYMSKRYKTHRGLFSTPFWIEGWSFYWELILWDRNFASSPEDRIGMLFWHMHRCARIVFSFKFHMGEMTPEECVDLLVEQVGHERANAEGEVRRSLNGDYPPLYQAAYMLGALQFYALRKEVVDEHGGRDTGEAALLQEKTFHDWVMKENGMPIELLRALLKNEKLSDDFSPTWRFYDGIDRSKK
jgi:hypothetical protein